MNKTLGPDKKIRLKSIEAVDFKRFSNLTVQNIPESAKLIMLAGPNGSGKSSFFDAMNTWHRHNWRQQGAWDAEYHRKTSSVKTDSWQNDVTVEFHNIDPSDLRERKKAFYFRSAYRNDPEFKANLLNAAADSLETVELTA
jgi:chromosome segregation ATPase